jgi:hypothetical protein
MLKDLQMSGQWKMQKVLRILAHSMMLKDPQMRG